MAETIEIKGILVRPENILTSPEAAVLQLADREELPCPRCGEPLWGEKILSEMPGIYQGVVLYCLNMTNCGFREY